MENSREQRYTEISYKRDGKIYRFDVMIAEKDSSDSIRRHYDNWVASTPEPSRFKYCGCFIYRESDKKKLHFDEFGSTFANTENK